MFSKQELLINLSEVSEKIIDMTTLMALGDLAVGEKVFKKCAACHSIVKDGKNNIVIDLKYFVISFICCS